MSVLLNLHHFALGSRPPTVCTLFVRGIRAEWVTLSPGLPSTFSFSRLTQVRAHRSATPPALPTRKRAVYEKAAAVVQGSASWGLRCYSNSHSHPTRIQRNDRRCLLAFGQSSNCQRISPYLALTVMLGAVGHKEIKTLCDPIDSTGHGILQARTLEWAAFPFSRGSSPPRDPTGVSCTAGRVFASWATREAPAWTYICHHV